MMLFLSGQLSRFEHILEELKLKQVLNYTKTILAEKVSTIDISTNKAFEDINVDFLFQYNIFPDNIMSYMTVWELENRNMKVGDTILQQVYLPPIKTFSLKIIFGVRIKEIIHLENKIGFSYETLEGHVEKGISTFTLEKEKQNIIFKIHTFSFPGNWLSKIAAPFFSIPFQSYCTNKALKKVKRQLETT
jgi:hypothetical protein